jgi:hypothetical protein
MFIFLRVCVRAQGMITEGEGSVQLTSLHFVVLISYLNEEVDRTESSSSVSVPRCTCDEESRETVMAQQLLREAKT